MGDCTRVHFRPPLSLRLDKPVFHPDKFSLSFSHQVGKQNRILNGRGGRLDSCSCHYYSKCICFGGKRQNRGKRCNVLTTFDFILDEVGQYWFLTFTALGMFFDLKPGLKNARVTCTHVHRQEI